MLDRYFYPRIKIPIKQPISMYYDPSQEFETMTLPSIKAGDPSNSYYTYLKYGINIINYIYYDEKKEKFVLKKFEESSILGKIDIRKDMQII